MRCMVFAGIFLIFAEGMQEETENARLYAENVGMQGTRLECKENVQGREDAKGRMEGHALQGWGQAIDSIS